MMKTALRRLIPSISIVTRLTKIKKEIINRLVLANGEKPVLDVINKTMTSFMFVKTTDEIET